MTLDGALSGVDFLMLELELPLNPDPAALLCSKPYVEKSQLQYTFEAVRLLVGVGSAPL